MAALFEHERRIAELAVQRAVLLTKRVLALVDKGAISKTDDTPVSLADYGGQALLIAAIHSAFPRDRIIGEESADVLRQNPTMAKKVWELVMSTHLDDVPSEDSLYTPTSMEEMLHLIDIGGQESASAEGRVWTMDPVDGTKAFLVGGHYAVCLVLLQDADEKVAVTACPHVTLANNIISESEVNRNGPGYMFSAVKGGGSQIRPLSTGQLAEAQSLKWRHNQKELRDVIFTENVDPQKPASSKRLEIARMLGAPWAPTHIYSTQSRYIALALGFVDIMLRIPISSRYDSFIWDHAGGILIFEEAGGKVTDLIGKHINLGRGRKLAGNFGILAASADLHSRVLRTVQEVMAGDEEYESFIRDSGENSQESRVTTTVNFA